jgi:inosine/xanthosine triphosphate pyrophosphatase family protein
METLVIHTENSSQTQEVKDLLQKMNVKIEVFSQNSNLQEELPQYVTKLMAKAIDEADNNKLTANEIFLSEVKEKYK